MSFDIHKKKLVGMIQISVYHVPSMYVQFSSVMVDLFVVWQEKGQL